MKQRFWKIFAFAVMIAGSATADPLVGHMSFAPLGTLAQPGCFNSTSVGNITEFCLNQGPQTDTPVAKGNLVTNVTGIFTALDIENFNYFVTLSPVNPTLLSGITPGTNIVTAVNFPALIKFGKTVDQPVNPLTNYNNFTFNATVMRVNQTPGTATTPGVLNIEFFGALVDGNGAYDSPASLDFAFTQSSIGGAISYSASFDVPGDVPPQPPVGVVPEPSTTVLLTGAFLGLGAFVRTRRKA